MTEWKMFPLKVPFDRCRCPRTIMASHVLYANWVRSPERKAVSVITLSSCSRRLVTGRSDVLTEMSIANAKSLLCILRTDSSKAERLARIVPTGSRPHITTSSGAITTTGTKIRLMSITLPSSVAPSVLRTSSTALTTAFLVDLRMFLRVYEITKERSWQTRRRQQLRGKG